MRTDYNAIFRDLIKVLEQCPVTSEMDWILRRNDLIVRARAALKVQPGLVESPVWTEGICEDGAAILKDGVMQPIEDVIAALNAAELSQPEPMGFPPRVGHILRLAEIIREVDGNHGKGAAALAEAILGHPDSRWEPREAQPKSVGPSLEEVEDLCEEHEFGVEGYESTECLQGLINDAVARYGGFTIAPISLSERLPESHEMNDEEEVWIWEPAFDYPIGDTGDYDIEPGKWVLRRIIPFDVRNNRPWLPYWTLPTPVTDNI